MKNLKIIIYLAFSVVIVACRGTVDSVVYGDSKTGIFLKFIDSNGDDIDLYMSSLSVYKKPKSTNELTEIYWEIAYPDEKINKNLQRHHLIKYGLTPKGYKVSHPIKKLSELQIYYYSIEGGDTTTAGCFYIKDNNVVQLSGTDC